MNYPDDFNTPTFPAGPRIASVRGLAIAIMVVFALIFCACGLLLWAQRSVRVHPFLISINNITGQWDIVGHNHGAVREMSTTRALQESVLGKFIQNWFWISDNATVNDVLWRPCKRENDCMPENNTGIDTGACALYCVSGADVFADFLSDVVPNYRLRAASGETWNVDTASIQMLPMGDIVDAGGTWQIRATIYSNMSAPIAVLAYVQVSRNADAYPQTLGYYVSEFNAYRMN